VALTDLTVRYGPREALRGVTVTFPAGEVTAVVGPSGCGKSTLLHAINRLHDLDRTVQVRGRVRVGDLDALAAGTDLQALRRRVGLIFQRPNVFPASVLGNVTLALRHHGARASEARVRAERALREVGLWDELGGDPSGSAERLSGGQQQRLCIARALALEPVVLLLDEPCSALDPVATARIERLLAGLRGRLTMVLVTHNLAQARRASDHLVCLWPEDGPGVLREHGPTAVLFERAQDATVGDYLRGRLG
jgi:phosphate transport system ATP-binding protein